MTWFDALTGFREESPQQVRENLTLEGETLKSRVNGRAMACGRLETPSLAELRERVRVRGHRGSKVSVREIVADVQQLHADESNAGSLFQVASQFNLLEMMSPDVTPEAGVGIYENDHTQGPACAIAAGAGTIFRNYFVTIDGHIGQSEGNQIDCLFDVGRELGNSGHRLWRMKNGYALASHSGLTEISDRLRAASDKELDEIRKLLRIGIQWNAQVTLRDCTHTVSQAYCSALPVAYSPHSRDLWEEFGSLVLEASYEATICAAILNASLSGNKKLFLTLLGAGAFGNAANWITKAIERALSLYADADLNIAIVSYGTSKPWVHQLVDHYSG